MDRAETAGLGVAAAGHIGLFVALSLGLGATQLPIRHNDPIEVSFTEDVGLTSAAPVITTQPPAPSIAPDLGPPEEAAPAPAETVAAPPQRPSPVPAPKNKAAPPRPQPKQKAAPRGSRFGEEFMKGLNPEASTSRSQDVPASEISAAAQSSLRAEIRRQLKPHWKAPTGADAELLRTELSIWLARDGTVDRAEVIGTSGQTASNRPQARLHQEQALRAVRLASPFRLPAEYYDAWKFVSPVRFDKRLSQ